MKNLNSHLQPYTCLQLFSRVASLLSDKTKGLTLIIAEPHSSFGSVEDLRTRSRWLDPWLGEDSFRELMIVIATGFIPLSSLSFVSTTIILESSQWLGKNIVRMALNTTQSFNCGICRRQ